MADFRISKESGFWVVRLGGSVVAETREAVLLDEDGRPPVVYFPRDAVAMALFERSATTTACPDKGAASYYSFTSPDAVMTDVAWSYEAPLAAAEAIRDHLAFDAERATVEQL